MNGKVLSLDIEHSTNVFRAWEKGFYMSCVGLVDSWDVEKVIWFEHETEAPTKRGLEVIQASVDWATTIVGQNLKHDMNILRYMGIDFEGKRLWCTMVSDYLLNGQDISLRYDLNSIAKRHDCPQKDPRVQTYWDRGIETYNIPSNILGPYVLQDCRIPLLLFYIQRKLGEIEGMKYLLNLQNEFQLALSDMEVFGFNFDVEKAENIIKSYSELAKPLVKEFSEMICEPHFNIGSPQQLSAALYGGLLKTKWREWTTKTYKTLPETKYYEKEFKCEKHIQGLKFVPLRKSRKKDGYYKTDKETIPKLKAKTQEQKRAKKLLVHYSKYAKVIETLHGKKKTKGLLNRIQPDGYIHPKFNQAIAKTGRLTSPEQQWPRSYISPIKQCIIPKFDGIMEIDLSQIEWRCAAELSGDMTMIREVNTGVDQHNVTCMEIMLRELNYENRTEAKVFNFRYIYGGSVWGYYLDPNMPNFSLKRWKEILKAMDEKYHGLIAWQDINIGEVWRTGELQIKTGRKFRFLKNLTDKDGVPTYNENLIKNAPVQGMAGGDLLPLAACVIRRGLHQYGLESEFRLTIHDSLVLDYKDKELTKLKRLAYSTVNNLHRYASNYFRIPWSTVLAGEVSIGPNYGQIKETPEDE
jgi:DNA polymerase I-like protein with 3'-5' exonuclease and polymerase domains